MQPGHHLAARSCACRSHPEHNQLPYAPRCSCLNKPAAITDQAFEAAAASDSASADASGSASSWFSGVVWWMWRSDPSSGGWNDMSFTPKGKPAGALMRAFAEKQGTLLVPDRLEPDVELEPAAAAAAGGNLLAAGPWPHKENGIVVGSGEWTSWEDDVGNSSHLDSAGAARSLASAKAHGVNSAEFIPT